MRCVVCGIRDSDANGLLVRGTISPTSECYYIVGRASPGVEYCAPCPAFFGGVLFTGARYPTDRNLSTWPKGSFSSDEIESIRARLLSIDVGKQISKNEKSGSDLER